MPPPAAAVRKRRAAPRAKRGVLARAFASPDTLAATALTRFILRVQSSHVANGAARRNLAMRAMARVTTTRRLAFSRARAAHLRNAAACVRLNRVRRAIDATLRRCLSFASRAARAAAPMYVASSTHSALVFFTSALNPASHSRVSSRSATICASTALRALTSFRTNALHSLIITPDIDFSACVWVFPPPRASPGEEAEPPCVVPSPPRALPLSSRAFARRGRPARRAPTPRG